MLPIVIVGSGLAGYSLVREIRKQNSDQAITLVTHDEGHSYAKPMLSNAFAQHKTPAMLINSTAENMANTHNIHLLSHTEARAIERENKKLQTNNGTLHYRSLVLAQGADSIRLPLQGNAAMQVLTVNDLADYNRFRNALAHAKHITILGAGQIGCEFANDLAAAGYKVDIIDSSAYPLSSLLPEIAGKPLIDALQKLGVTWHFGLTVQQVNTASRGYLLTLSNNRQLHTDLVLSALGRLPRTNLAKEAGLVVHHAIVVDAQLRSSDPDIYALGDCAEIEQRWLPYVEPIMLASRTLAEVLLGKEKQITFPVMPIIIKTLAHPVVVVPVAPSSPGEWRILAQGQGIKLGFYTPDETLKGFVLTGEYTNERARMVQVCQ